VIPADINIDALLKRLHLASARRNWRSMIERAEKEAWSCRDFLALLVAEEVAIASKRESSDSPAAVAFRS
jgi:hypothetical protein